MKYYTFVSLLKTQNTKHAIFFFQDGFGWTNGVILDLLVTYSDRMTIADIGDELTPKPIKPCRKKTNRIDYNIIIMIMLHAIIFYFAKCAFTLQIQPIRSYLIIFKCENLCHDVLKSYFPFDRYLETKLFLQKYQNTFNLVAIIISYCSYLILFLTFQYFPQKISVCSQNLLFNVLMTYWFRHFVNSIKLLRRKRYSHLYSKKIQMIPQFLVFFPRLTVLLRIDSIRPSNPLT